MSICRKFTVIGLTAALAACASPPPLGGAPGATLVQTVELPAPSHADYAPDPADGAIRALDVIQVDVFGVEELSREVQVSANGTIDYPLIGSLEAVGRTSDELSFEIEARLRDTYVRQPDVTSRITERNEQFFTVGGEVAQPGRFPIASSITLMEAVAIGGGFSEFAKEDEILVFRTVGEDRYIGVYNLEGIQRGNYADPDIYPSDIVMVGDSPGRRRLETILEITAALSTPLIVLERVLNNN